MTACVYGLLSCCPARAADPDPMSAVRQTLSDQCLDCHSGAQPEGGFDVDRLLDQLQIHGNIHEHEIQAWIKIYDRVAAGDMPPEGGLPSDRREDFVASLRAPLVKLDRQQAAAQGRTVWRRMNRFEYENSVRDLLGAPWLQLASMLPEDGELHRFNKVGEALDVSHVNLSRYMQAADFAMREVLADQASRPETAVTRFYAREQSGFSRKLRFSQFNRSPERATFPLLLHQADRLVLQNAAPPYTVGAGDPETREQEAFGVVASSYEPIEIRFDSFIAPRSGRYKLRFKGYTFWAGIENEVRRRASREDISRGRRSEPVVIYSQRPPRQLRRLGQFDFQIEPTVQELDVWLLQGESIQPDAARLFRSRPPRWQNPLAEEDGMPGVAFQWMEVKGPIEDRWPPRGHQLLFDDLEIRHDDRQPVVVPEDTVADTRRLMARFVNAAYRRQATDADIDRFVAVVESALSSSMTFADAMLAGYTAVLCSPQFLCLEERPGVLDQAALASRLSLFLRNSLPDARLRELAASQQLREPESLRAEANRLLDDAASRQFVDAFLDYWLDLRKINDTSPDEILYPDYYLDDMLVDSARAETQLFFAELLRENLPARNLIDSDFTFVNERLARHYGLPLFEGARLRRVTLPPDSVRGGLLTQASVLKVTANGTTTSPVVRGAWINERILGVPIPPPPASVPAIEPDTRGATTVRKQLELHRADESCNACHRLIDPAGFALESFDVAGGFRVAYRSLGGDEPIPGFGKNGQPFTFSDGPEVDASGQLPDGRAFRDIVELKQLLLADERGIARNLVEKLVTYATGAPPRFSDRVEIEAVLDRTAAANYPVRSLIEEIVVSQMFRNK